MVKKYHPDQYRDNPLSSLAEEKLKEANEAYDYLTKKQGGRTFRSGNYTDTRYGAGSTGNYSNSRYGAGSAGSDYDYTDELRSVRNLMEEGRFAEAQVILENMTVRNAEWNYLVGLLYGKKGWYTEAYRYISIACRLDPGNYEYTSALNSMSEANQSYMGRRYRGGMLNAGNYCGVCPICVGLMCSRGFFCF